MSSSKLWKSIGDTFKDNAETPSDRRTNKNRSIINKTFKSAKAPLSLNKSRDLVIGDSDENKRSVKKKISPQIRTPKALPITILRYEKETENETDSDGAIFHDPDNDRTASNMDFSGKIVNRHSLDLSVRPIAATRSVENQAHENNKGYMRKSFSALQSSFSQNVFSDEDIISTGGSTLSPYKRTPKPLSITISRAGIDFDKTKSKTEKTSQMKKSLLRLQRTFHSSNKENRSKKSPKKKSPNVPRALSVFNVKNETVTSSSALKMNNSITMKTDTAIPRTAPTASNVPTAPIETTPNVEGAPPKRDSLNSLKRNLAGRYLTAEQEMLENSIVVSSDDDEIAGTPPEIPAPKARRLISETKVPSQSSGSFVESNQVIRENYIETESSGTSIRLPTPVVKSLSDGSPKRKKVKKGGLVEALRKNISRSKTNYAFWINERDLNSFTLIPSGETLRIDEIEHTYGRVLVYCQPKSGLKKVIFLDPDNRKLPYLRPGKFIEIDFDNASCFEIDAGHETYEAYPSAYKFHVLKQTTF